MEIGVKRSDYLMSISRFGLFQLAERILDAQSSAFPSLRS